MREIRRATEKHLAPEIAKLARSDAASPTVMDVRSYVSELARRIADGVLPAFGAMSSSVSAANLRALADLGIDVRHDGSIAPMLSHLRDWNLRLMTQAASEYSDQVAAVLSDPAAWGLRVEELSALISERGDVAESKAMLIARDQTLKTYAGISRIRQQNAGATSYVWSTSGDDRVRDTHRANEGQTFSWAVPPAETGHPGEDVQCRCVAVPVIDGLDDEDG